MSWLHKLDLNIGWKYSILIFAIVATVICSAKAEIIIVSSDVSSMPVCKSLEDDAVLEIPENGNIGVLKLPEEITYQLRGPHNGTLADYVEKYRCPLWKQIVGQCPESTLGGGRGLKTHGVDRPDC